VSSSIAQRLNHGLGVRCLVARFGRLLISGLVLTSFASAFAVLLDADLANAHAPGSSGADGCEFTWNKNYQFAGEASVGGARSLTVTPSTGTAAAVTNTFNAASQLMSVGATAFTYDNAGRRLTETAGATVTSYAYDPQGRLASTTRGATVVSRGYDPDDNLVTVTNGASVTAVDWDPTSGVAQPTLMGGQRFVGGPDGWLQTRTGVADTNVGRDVFGSLITPAATVRSTGYDSFGKPNAGANTFTPTLGYRGEITIDSLTYLRARDYDAANGVFTTRDPLDGIVGTTVVGNPYHYGNNNPLTNTDPTGMSSMGDDLFGVTTDAFGNSYDTRNGGDLIREASGQWVTKQVFWAAQQKQATAVMEQDAARAEYLDRISLTEFVFVETASQAAGAVCGVGGVLVGGPVVAGAISAVCQGAVNRFGMAYASDEGLQGAWEAATDASAVGQDAAMGAAFGGLGKLVGQAGRAGSKVDDIVETKAANLADDIQPAANTVDDLVGAACSFSGETRVLMADGTTKPISEIEVGDEVLAYDPETGERGPRRVIHLWVHEDTLLELELGGAQVETTEDHPFWNATDEAWQQAEDLDVGDQVLSADGRTIVVGGLHESTAFTGTAFNLTVENIHTYFVQVGTSEVLVHNTGCDFALKVDRNTGSLILDGPMVDPTVVRGMSRGDLVELQEMLEVSVANRRADQVSSVFSSVDPAHTARIADEERLLSQVNDLLGG
jgi:RHS repeat-associated protein